MQANQCLLGAREQLSESPELKIGEKKSRTQHGTRGENLKEIGRDAEILPSAEVKG